MEIQEIDTQKILAEIEKGVEKIFSEFSKLNVAVLGDSMFDSYLIGDTTRISPEAPVPVVQISKSYFKPGGAANTAVNIKKIGGCKVKLFSVVGEDKEGDILEDLMKKEGVEVSFIRDSSRPTTQKTRVIARGQHVVRIDTEKTHNIEDALAEKIISELKKEEFDVIVLSDYAKGFFSEKITNAIKEKRNSTKILCDPKPQNIKLFEGLYMILPNIKEAYEIKKIVAGGKEENLYETARKIRENLKIKKIVITQGEDGLSFFSENKAFHIIAFAKDVYDVTGAGDTTTAAFALCEGIGLEDEKSAAFASVCASCKVSHLGTYSPTKTEIVKTLKNLINFK